MRLQIEPIILKSARGSVSLRSAADCRLQIVCALLALASCACFAEKVTPTREAAATVVVFNNKDSDSVALAGYYAEKRGIPFTQLVGIDCGPKEEITREEYDRDIAAPLRAAFAEHGWWRLEKGPDGVMAAVQNKMRFVAVMRGVPLKIAPAVAYPGDTPPPGLVAGMNNNAASVDSELTLLGNFGKQITGPANNPFFGSETPFMDTDMPALMLVCRLDAADAKTVRRMIDDSLWAERNGLWGFCYADTRGLAKENGLVAGDKWIQDAATDAQRNGFPAILDNGAEIFPDAYPMRHAALYYGWYAADVSGPIAQPDFRFERGAVAVHLHSFSALSLRDPSHQWCAPLLAHGTAATLGNVYEPLLGLTANLDVFQQHLTKGFNFAESSYASARGLSWMNIFVGDPLYRPFSRLTDENKTPKGAPPEWVACRDALRAWRLGNSGRAGQILRTRGGQLHNGVPFETLGLLLAAEHKLDASFEAFAQARKYYADRGDYLRTWIHQVNLLRFNGRGNEALADARRLIKAFPKERATNVFRLIERQLAPPPPTVTPATSGTAAARK
jgi:uncharacterized protein (TIGR03790 family)